jgi:hypothetical protein
MVYRLYGDMLHSIPVVSVPGSSNRKEQRHEAA